MQQHHAMNIAVSSGGQMKVEVVFKERVPDLLSRYPRDVQQKARRLSWWPDRYERKLWQAAHGMPQWARETVRQHILSQRAERITQKLHRKDERRREWELRRQAKMTATQEVAEGKGGPMQGRRIGANRPDPVTGHEAGRRSFGRKILDRILARRNLAAAPVPAADERPLPGQHSREAGTALSTTGPGRLSLVDRLARDHAPMPVHPRSAVSRGRGR